MTGAGDRAKTLLVLTPRPPWQGGGLEGYVSRIVEGLADRHGWRVVLVTTGSDHAGVQRDDVGPMRVYRLPYQVQVSNTRFSARWRRQLRAIVDDESPDVVNAHTPTPGLADVASDVIGTRPFVVTYHTGSMRKGRWPADLFVGLYEGILRPRLLTRADSLIACSEFVRDTVLADHRRKCAIVTPGVDAVRFSPGRPPARPTVLFVAGLGRGDAHKGLDTLLGGLAVLARSHPDVRLHVVGSGDARDDYERMARQLGVWDRVRFLGRLAGDALVEAYRTATVFTLPTTNESFGMVLLEAMACGLPVVSTTAGGVPALVDDGRDGFLVGPGDAAALAARLGRILDDPGLAARMGRAGRDKAERCYRWDERVDRTDAILRAVMAGGRRAEALRGGGGR